MSDIKIPLFKVNMSEEAVTESSKILSSGYIGQGPVVDDFEQKLSNYLKLPNFANVVTSNSATAAEHMALHMLKTPSKLTKMFPEHGGMTVNDWPGMECGDEVLCTSLTCTATNWPVLANNFKIKWVDVNPDNLNMDLDDLRRKITPKTKVIYFVHWGGYPVDLDEVEKIRTETYNMYGFRPIVIEDCAHSFGSKYKNQYIGSHGNICTFSFQAIKHLTSVDGGMLITPYKEHYEGSYIYVDQEEMYIETIADNKIVVRRAQDKTPLQNHVSGSKVFNINAADNAQIELGDDFGFDGTVF